MVARMATSGTAEIQQVGKTSKTYSMKGKERKLHQEQEKQGPHLISDRFCIMQRKRSTRLVLISCVSSSTLDILSTRRRTRIASCYLQGNLVSLGLMILVIGNGPNGPTRRQGKNNGEEIEVVELKKVGWLDIRGKFDRTIDLSPGTIYEIVFVVRMIDDGKTQRNESLEGKPVEEWFEILVGEFIMSLENVGSVEFSMDEHGAPWKSGLIVKCAIIRPKV
ncbi:unnamed protein product [Camellia sinensis]